jgi:hypothetical protein
LFFQFDFLNYLALSIIRNLYSRHLFLDLLGELLIRNRLYFDWDFAIERCELESIR